MTTGSSLALALALAGCGYAPAHGATDAAALALALDDVEVHAGLAPDAVANAAALEGARLELARLGMRAAKSTTSSTSASATRRTLVLEVVDVREGPAALGATLDDRASAGGLEILVTARAFVRVVANSAASGSGRHEGVELVARETVAGSSRVAPSLEARSVAVRRAARRLGRELVREAVGLGGASD